MYSELADTDSVACRLGGGLKVAYLVNQYPKVSHSFIRRELLGIEACGIEVARFAVRDCADELVDEGDRQELQKTQFLLAKGLKGLLPSLLQTAVKQPSQFAHALGLAWKLGWRSDRGWPVHLIYLAEACLLAQWLRQGKVEHLHVHFGTNSTTVALFSHVLTGIPYSFTAHGPEEFDRLDRIALTEKIEHAAFVVAISSYGRSQLYRWCDHVYWSKIHVVHCGVDDSFLAHPFVPIPDVPKLVCVGRLSEQKGQLLLLEAAAKLAAEGLPFQLILVGDGPLRKEIEQIIDRYQLQSHVQITGWASNAEVRQHLLGARAMVLPSFAEGLPVVIMEALALYRPVVTTYVAGIPELVVPGECGWLVPPGSVEDLVEAMRSVLLSPVETLEKLGKLGAKRVASQHHVLVEASRLADLFRRYGNAKSGYSSALNVDAISR